MVSHGFLFIYIDDLVYLNLMVYVKLISLSLGKNCYECTSFTLTISSQVNFKLMVPAKAK